MHRIILVFVLLVVACGGDSTRPVGPGADGPYTGTMPEGDWGGEGWLMTVHPGGTASLLGSCGRGEVELPIRVNEGSLAFTFEYRHNDGLVESGSFSGMLDEPVRSLSGSVAMSGRSVALNLALGAAPVIDFCD